ncbi:BQ5605_C006g03840 [Microbotryum silenes-dioicae]|uniref:ATP-dependent DNA helicase n=1 Tax=Microbotryum silenes-dioicae TaxID=796604 RepID=A0A2X0MZG5_9BASI|nr:BQ5605_C006g03840 [Microbotryum silenes-dioicae]
MVSTFRAFIAHRYRSVTAVHQTLSGLAHWFGPLMGSEWEEVRSNRLVRAAIVGGQKLWRHAPVRAKPLPFDVLSTTLRRARSDPLLDYDRLCFLAMLALAFGACARSGKLTLPDTIRFRDADKLPSCNSVIVSKTGFRVRLPYHKADQRWRGSFLQVVTRATRPHFIDVLSLFLAACDFRFRTMGVGAKLFLTSSGVPPTRNWFITRLHAEFGRKYSGHLLHSGGATHYAILGFLPAKIQRIGCWKSAAWEEYFRTFWEACVKRGLLRNDKEADRCLTKAAVFCTGHKLRHLFAMLLTANDVVTNAAQLWTKHYDNLTQDVEYQLRNQRQQPIITPEHVASWGLLQLSNILQQLDSSLSDHGLPLPTIQFDDEASTNWLIMEESATAAELNKLEGLWRNNFESCNTKQCVVVETVLDLILNSRGKVFFIDAPGGTGKTFLEKMILARICSEGKYALAVASLGIAALVLPKGRTAHSRFKIPIDIFDNSTCNVPKQGQLAELFRMCDLIVWDEAPMQHCRGFQLVDRMLQDVRSSTARFGGLTVVLAGDPKQCLPVIPKSSSTQIVNFVDAPGGTGKTFLEETVLARIRSEGTYTLAVASSGIAALLLPKGSMAHSRFKIPIDIFDDSMCNVPKQEQLAELWDEVPMQHRQSFQLVDRMLQHVRSSTAQFGGLTVVLAGACQSFNSTAQGSMTN